MKLLPPRMRAAFVGLGVLAGLCGAERPALAQRVYGPTGRPYGPTQSQYQYQRQYGRAGGGLNGYGAAVANGPGSTHQWLSPGFTGGSAGYRGGAYGNYGGYHYHGPRSGWAAGGYGYGYGVPFGYGYGPGYGFSPGYGWGYGGYGVDCGLYASPYGYGGLGFGAVAYPAMVAATPAPFFLNGPGVNLTGGGVGFAASDELALSALNANADAAALTALGNNPAGNGFGNPPELPLPPADPATRPLKFSTADQKLRSLQAQSSGDGHMRRQAWQRAYADYKRAVELADDSGSAHFRLGCVLTTLKYYGSAVKSFRRALHADPLLPNQRPLLDRIYGEDSIAVRKQLVNRLIDYANADLRDPDRLFLLGVYLHYEGDPRSTELFQAAASQLPGMPAHIQAFLNADRPAVGANAAPAPLAAPAAPLAPGGDGLIDDAIPPPPGGPAAVPRPPQPLFKATPVLTPRKPDAAPARPTPIDLPPIQQSPDAIVPPARVEGDAAGDLPPAPVPDEQLPPVAEDDPVRRDADLPLTPP